MPTKTLRTRRDISISRCGTPAMLGAPPGTLLCCTPGTTAMPISCALAAEVVVDRPSGQTIVLPMIPAAWSCGKSSSETGVYPLVRLTTMAVVPYMMPVRPMHVVA